MPQQLVNPSDVQKALLSDILDMRADIIRRTDALIALLRSEAFGGPLPLNVPATPNPAAHRSSLFLKSLNRKSFTGVSVVAPSTAPIVARKSNTSMFGQEEASNEPMIVPTDDPSDISTYLDMGVRWDEADYATSASKQVPQNAVHYKLARKRQAMKAKGGGDAKPSSIFKIMNTSMASTGTFSLRKLRSPEDSVTRRSSVREGPNRESVQSRISSNQQINTSRQSMRKSPSEVLPIVRVRSFGSVNSVKKTAEDNNATNTIIVSDSSPGGTLGKRRASHSLLLDPSRILPTVVASSKDVTHPSTNISIVQTAAVGRASAVSVGISSNDDVHQTETMTAIENENMAKHEQEMYEHFTQYDRIFFYFLIPAFDGKGRILTLDQFDQSDFDGISFRQNGIHPKSCFSTLWDFGMSIVFIAILWAIPFIIAFQEEVEANMISAISIGISAVFPQAESSPLCSFREYEAMRPDLDEWMMYWIKYVAFLDLISAIPFELIPTSNPNFVYCFLIRFLRFYRLPSMLTRCAIFKRIKTHLEESFGTGISTVISLTALIFAFIHINACAIYITGKAGGFAGWNNIWPDFNGASYWRVYCWTVFQGAGNLFPMSLKPLTAAEQLVAILFIVSGAVLYAVFIGSISSAAMSIDSSGRLYNQKMEELVDYVKWKNLSDETKRKLVSYYETKYRGKYFEEESLLADMNESLRTEILHQNTRDLIEQVPFLRRTKNDGRDEVFYNGIANVLHARYFIPGDYITKQGDTGLDMFFILSGKVHVFVNGHKVVSLYDGSYIGEVALIAKGQRTASARAAMPTVVYRLTFQDFHTVIEEFPDIRKRFDKLAKEREKMLSRS
ncbi:hypothetical protein BDR26DRAFT_863285 [Obelidium mucronatum]|nr:hypothetical protein BDR26DRAFT_863285 [Obelidium mucronatum]